jgi:hypothetical protein
MHGLLLDIFDFPARQYSVTATEISETHAK